MNMRCRLPFFSSTASPRERAIPSRVCAFHDVVLHRHLVKFDSTRGRALDGKQAVVALPCVPDHEAAAADLSPGSMAFTAPPEISRSPT